MFKKLSAVILVLVMLMGLGLGLAEVSLTDLAGRSVTLDKAAEKIVVIEPGDLEILHALGGMNKVVGIGGFCNYPAEEVKNIPVVSGFEGPNLEAIVALKPDVVVMSTMGLKEGVLDSMEKAGLKVVLTKASNLEGVYQAIDLMGKVSALEDAAKALSASMQAQIESYAALHQGKSAGSVYFEVSPLQYGLWAAGADSFMHDLAKTIGLENVFGDVSGWAEVSAEKVIEKNPDFIISTGFGDPAEVKKEIMERKGWENVNAIKNDKVFVVNADIFSRPGPRLLEALSELVKIVLGAPEMPKAA